MRIAFFGGSFDPPHAGHIAIALAAIQRLQLDQVLMAPVGNQPLKRNGAQSSYADRLAMIRLVCAEHVQLVPSELDAPRADAHPNYTYDTLFRLKDQLAAEDRLFFLLGFDSLLSLRKWHRAGDLLRLCDFIVAGRPGFSLEQLDQCLPEGFSHGEHHDEANSAELVEYRLRAEDGSVHSLYLMPDLQYDISATAIRTALLHGTEKDGAGGPSELPSIIEPAVAEYVRTHHLYSED